MSEVGRNILTDPSAISADSEEPAFLARPQGSAVYHGFPIVEESDTDGWRIGAISEFIGSEEGDAYVIAPDESRAGLVWEVGEGEFSVVCEPEHDRWGIYAVWFPNPVTRLEDFVENFRHVLPDLQRKFNEIKGKE